MIRQTCISLMVGFMAVVAQLQPVAFDKNAMFEMIRESQIFLARAMPKEAEEQLIIWDKNHPEVRKDPLFCYQRFFVALQGHGDRKTAKLMLDRMNALVQSGKLDPYRAEYQSVTEAWYRGLQHADSDLPRRAHHIMSTRLASNPHWADGSYFKR
ncbi:MAG: hypothetical protein RL346_1400 [Verrucomicrobiota bacterium]